MEFLSFIKAVGTGKKSNRNLKREELREAMCAILEQNVYPEQISAFLLGWRVKGESIEELQGALDAFASYIVKKPIANSIEFGYPYDGKVKNPYLFPLIAKYLKTFDVQLSLHGDILQPAKGGITLRDICLHLPMEENIHFFDRKDFFPQLHHLSEIRNKLGIRTTFNTLEKMPGITQSETAILGAFHKPFIEKYIELFRDKYKRLVIIKGNESTPEIFSKCSVIIVENNQQEEIKVDPKNFGINYQKSTFRISIEESLELIKNPGTELTKLSQLNAGVILFILRKVKTIEEGFSLFQ